MNPWIIEQLAAENRAQHLATAEKWRAAHRPRAQVEARRRERALVSGLTRILGTRRGSRLLNADPIVSKACF
jgi:hypothetical protein